MSTSDFKYEQEAKKENKNKKRRITKSKSKSRNKKNNKKQENNDDEDEDSEYGSVDGGNAGNGDGRKLRAGHDTTAAERSQRLSRSDITVYRP